MSAATPPLTSRRQWLLHALRAAILTSLAGLSWMLSVRSGKARCQRPQQLCQGCVLWRNCRAK